MPYTDFTLQTAQSRLGLTADFGDLFPDLKAVSVPASLAGQLASGRGLPLGSEKARSEFIVAPILMAVRDATAHEVTIFSGERFDVDPQRSLHGECDFILTRSKPLPQISAPLVTIVEAKKLDVDAGLGQCVAQMVAAQVFNERAGEPRETIFGCVTTGEVWQFLGLTGTEVTIHRPRIYIDAVGLILAAFARAVAVESPAA